MPLQACSVWIWGIKRCHVGDRSVEVSVNCLTLPQPEVLTSVEPGKWINSGEKNAFT